MRASSNSPTSRHNPLGRSVRSKNGCMTCRLRGKKCDEERLELGHDQISCATCDRMKLECLGYGVKRPQWMKDKQKLNEVKKHITAHLKAQGLVKGQTTSVARNVGPVSTLRISEIAAESTNGDSGSMRSNQEVSMTFVPSEYPQVVHELGYHAHGSISFSQQPSSTWNDMDHPYEYSGPANIMPNCSLYDAPSTSEEDFGSSSD